MCSNNKNIVILTTGGTIDKTYDESAGSLENRESSIKNGILSRLRLPYTVLKVRSLMAKDSLTMTKADRLAILDSVRQYQSKGVAVVIIHGTDTMDKTAKLIFDSIEKPTSPVIFTGAMRPMGFEDSDAEQNVAEALLASKILPPGIYISFHNQVFKVPNAKKYHDQGTFGPS